MTSAPKSDRITAALGPAMKLARSTTFSPEKILSLAMAVFPFAVRAASAAAKLRCSLLQKGRGAFLLVFGCGADAEVGGFQRKTLRSGWSPIPLFAASSENFTAIGALAAICFRIVSARSIRPAAGTTSLTRPMR